MRRPSIVWRGIVRIERHLPSVAVGQGDAGRPSVARRRWTGFAIMVPSIALAATQILTHRVDWATAWPASRPVILQLLLIVAGAALVAAVAAGLVAWRAEGRRHA